MKTYNEIKKAMQIHANREPCAECPYAELPMDRCERQMFIDAIELFKKYKAENEKLKGQ